MINRICISINNRCNLKCYYCHFHEKSEFIESRKTDVFKILDNVKAYIEKYNVPVFKIGFVGNGEPLLDYDRLKEYIIYISDELKKGKISAYTITNGTLVNKEMLLFFKDFGINVGFSLDGIRSIHNKLRCNSYDKVMAAIELYREVNGFYPSINCTVGEEVINHTEETIAFLKKFNSRITFSRMIGSKGITAEAFGEFMKKAKGELEVRTGGYDCTMYGGKCGAALNNFFFANGYVYICGNCVDLPSPYKSDTPIDKIKFNVHSFDRNTCYKEGIK